MNYSYMALKIAALTALFALAACQPILPPSEEADAPEVSSPSATATPTHTSTLDASKYKNVWVQAIEEIENEGRSLLRIAYPITENDAINARMEAVTQEFIDEYRNDAAEIEASYQEYKRETGKEAATFITHYLQLFDVSIANENVIFFDIVRSIHTGGTGNSFVVGYIFDRRTGVELTIPNLFVDDSYLERLSTLAGEALAERARAELAELEFDSDDARKEALEFDLDWIKEGTSPAAENFDNVLFQEDGTFLVKFDKYQVAPGAAGVVEVTLPVADIADLLKLEIRQLLGIEEEEAAQSTLSFSIMEVEESENDDRSQLFVSYPVTDQEEINARIEEISQQFIDEYRMKAAEIEEEYQEYKKETGKEAASFVTIYRQDHEVTVLNQDAIFFAVARSRYTGGTGNVSVSSYIFDRRSGAQITIPELFVDDSYLQRLSTLAREALTERRRSQIAETEPDADDDRKKELLESNYRFIEMGTMPTAENFDFIVFQDNGTVLIRFDKYQVASGAEGAVEIELAVSAIADLLEPEIRDLLGFSAETTSLRSGMAAQALELARAEILAFPQRAASRNLATFVQVNAHVSFQATSPAQDDINCYEVACVALTFDDGPSFHTEGLLDILKERNVKATFFVLGAQVRIQSETVLRMFQEGHQIGNHTWDHPNLTKLSDDQIREQLQLTDNLVAQIIGESTPFLRPPYGAYNDKVLAASGLPIIFWSVDPLDWKDRDAEIVAARIIEAPVGAIILSHDIHKSTVDAVPVIIAALKSRGIRFVTVTKLFEPQVLLPQKVYIDQPASPSK